MDHAPDADDADRATQFFSTVSTAGSGGAHSIRHDPLAAQNECPSQEAGHLRRPHTEELPHPALHPPTKGRGGPSRSRSGAAAGRARADWHRIGGPGAIRRGPALPLRSHCHDSPHIPHQRRRGALPPHMYPGRISAAYALRLARCTSRPVAMHAAGTPIVQGRRVCDGRRAAALCTWRCARGTSPRSHTSGLIRLTITVTWQRYTRPEHSTSRSIGSPPIQTLVAYQNASWACGARSVEVRREDRAAS
ncbi:hypothetical protein FA95DRAFT_86248 [Auriscalpium vulgare]|uniref:Uncharacterized protein n=1 Tax=Auriscalpium vulgare TaxID=40419 RepID=A0ACB8RNX7_9AGAM|nr:hypothetical protein FA95DRAFT_86248 [Auriscalpium vulgare]